MLTPAARMEARFNEGLCTYDKILTYSYTDVSNEDLCIRPRNR